VGRGVVRVIEVSVANVDIPYTNSTLRGSPRPRSSLLSLTPK